MQDGNQINELIVGIDVSKDKLDVMILPMKSARQIENKPNAIKRFVKSLKTLGPIKRVICESTGGYERALVKILCSEEVPCHVAHPNYVYHFAKARGVFAKTDKIDANLLAEYGRQEDITANAVYSAQQEELEQLSSRRRQIKKQITAEKNRLAAAELHTTVKRSIKRFLKLLKTELTLLDREVKALIKTDTQKLKQIELLKTFKGVGEKIAEGLTIDLPELGHLGRRGIACLVGVAPRNHDSGKKTGKRIISAGRGAVRQLCYLAALVAVRHNTSMKLFYERLIAKGKPAKVALIAVARKIVLVLNSMVRHNNPWNAAA